MKSKALMLSVGLFFATFLFIQYGLSIIKTGRLESRWILKEMWGDISIPTKENLADYEAVYIKSLRETSSSDSDVVDYVWREKCRDRSERCYFTMMAAANLMFDHGHYDSGLSAATQGVELDKKAGECPIAFESVILRYKLKKIHLMDGDRSRSESKKLISKIKSHGGISKNLRSSSCKSLAKEKPTFFREYIALIAHLMVISGGESAKTGVYIESVIENDLGEL